MSRMRMTLIAVALLAATLVIPVTTASPAAAAINRCGLAYSQKTGPISLHYDNDPSIQPFRFRIKPSTPRDVCVEFMSVNPNYRTRGHIISFYDHGDAPAAKICGLRVCRWHSDDNHILTKVVVYAQHRSSSTNPWVRYEGSAVLELAS